MLRFQGGQEQTRGPKAENPGLLSIQGQDSAPSSISSKECELRDVAPSHWGGCPCFRQAVCLESDNPWPALHLGRASGNACPQAATACPSGPDLVPSLDQSIVGCRGWGDRLGQQVQGPPAALSCHQPVASGAGRKPLGSSNQKEGS